MSEIERILALPVRNETGEEFVEAWTEKTRAPTGSWSLHPHQALALEYAANADAPGLFLPITVGGGKTLLGQLLPKALGVDPEKVVVLCPAPLVAEAEREWSIYREHFDVPFLRYVSYANLSRDQELLERLEPELIIADEAHALKNPSAARTRRFIRYLRPRLASTRFVAMSATFTSASLNEYAHLSALALGDSSPLPVHYAELQEWARVLDVNPKLPPQKSDWAKLAPLVRTFTSEEERESIRGRDLFRLAFGRRFASTPGVVITDGDSCDKPLRIGSFAPKVPEALKAALSAAEETFLLPNGEIIPSQLELAAKTRQLTLGWYYYWDWPDGEPDFEWLHRRSAYYSELEALRRRGRKGLDTQMLIERELELRTLSGPPSLLRAWEEWKEVRERPEPPRGLHVVTDEILSAAVNFARTLGPDVLVWYHYEAEAEILESLGVRVFRAGERPSGGGVVGVSTRSHATGLNLQYEWSKNLVLSPPSNGGLWQQLLGRTHRNGQPAETVECYYLRHHKRLSASFAKACKSAQYIEETQGLRQKLNYFEKTD